MISPPLSSSSKALIRMTEGLFLPVPWDNPLLKLSGWAGERLAEILLDQNTKRNLGRPRYPQPRSCLLHKAGLWLGIPALRYLSKPVQQSWREEGRHRAGN